jgi:hypothetical protein
MLRNTVSIKQNITVRIVTANKHVPTSLEGSSKNLERIMPLLLPCFLRSSTPRRFTLAKAVSTPSKKPDKINMRKSQRMVK